MFGKLLKSVQSALRQDSSQSRWFVMLNHNPDDASVPDDVTLFGSLEALAGDLSPEDLARGGYEAVCSRGAVVTLRPARDGESVEATIAAVPSAEGRAAAFLRHYLVDASETRPTLGLDPAAIEREGDLARLAAMVPPKDIGA
ncbi:MAG TPA: hypothetical protein PK264_03535 [Hyphomicrobiaceae bacterium]|nr:hypothetical protein [Hyphomicrobiaceae bacterium]